MHMHACMHIGKGLNTWLIIKSHIYINCVSG